MDYPDFIISSNSTILDAVRKIELNRSRAVFIVSNEKIIGILSEGDIIRALLQGLDIHSQAQNIANISFAFMKSNDIPNASKIMAKKNITIIPVVDHNMKLLNIISLQDVLKNLLKNR